MMGGNVWPSNQCVQVQRFNSCWENSETFSQVNMLCQWPLDHPISRTFSYGTYTLFFHVTKDKAKRGSARKLPLDIILTILQSPQFICCFSWQVISTVWNDIIKRLWTGKIYVRTQARQNRHMIKRLIHGPQDSLYSTSSVSQINN